MREEGAVGGGAALRAENDSLRSELREARDMIAQLKSSRSSGNSNHHTAREQKLLRQIAALESEVASERSEAERWRKRARELATPGQRRPPTE